MNAIEESESIHQSKLSALYQTVFSGGVISISPLKGDGSDRRIYRVLGNRQTAIGVYGPNLAENKAFLGFTRTFLKHELPVPAIHAVSDDDHYYIESDLGDVTLFDWQKARRIDEAFPREAFEMYAKVLRFLPRFQILAGKDIDYTLCYQHREFAEDAMWFDARYFEEMFLSQFMRQSINLDAFDVDCARLIAWLCSADRSHFLYRDFQSRNIMIAHGEPHFLDYQSGRRGALQYDAASLLYDANARIPEDVRRKLLNEFVDEIANDIVIDRSGFIALFDGFAILRVMQALGAFGNLGLRKNKCRFLLSIPQGLRNLATLAERAAIMSSLPYLRTLFTRIATDDALLNITENYERTSR